MIHGGLSRHLDLTLEDLATVNSRRQPPPELSTKDDDLLFDALWYDDLLARLTFHAVY